MIVPNLLVIDDDSAFRSAVCEGLLRRGFKVDQAGDGQEALDVMETKRFHLALVDVHMPRVTGLELLRRLPAIPDRPACVLMSAQLDEAIRLEAERMKAYRVLSKPIRLAALCEVVTAVLLECHDWRPA